MLRRAADMQLAIADGPDLTPAIYEENDGSPDEIANGESVWS
jgi:hypothetical protein